MYNHFLLQYVATKDLLISKITEIPNNFLDLIFPDMNFFCFNNSLCLMEKMSLLQNLPSTNVPNYFLQTILDQLNSPHELEYFARILQNKFQKCLSNDLSLVLTRKDRLRLASKKFKK